MYKFSQFRENWQLGFIFTILMLLPLYGIIQDIFMLYIFFADTRKRESRVNMYRAKMSMFTVPIS